MIEARLTKHLLEEFYHNLRCEDAQELNALLGKNSVDIFIDICLNARGETYFLLSDELKPLALGGASLIEDKNIAKIWLLSTNEANKYKKDIFKYVKNKIEKFKNTYELLYNYIYKTNFNSLYWLKRLGFKVLNFSDIDYKLFYFSKGEDKFDLRYFAGK